MVLFDSDWNPQVDIQAMDRAHRIGQTKPVIVYRFVTEQSIEEKVLERAFKKLFLDAMVVQQGRLVDKHKAASKDELLEMIRFGADTVIRMGDSEANDFGEKQKPSPPLPSPPLPPPFPPNTLIYILSTCLPFSPSFPPPPSPPPSVAYLSSHSPCFFNTPLPDH